MDLGRRLGQVHVTARFPPRVSNPIQTRKPQPCFVSLSSRGGLQDRTLCCASGQRYSRAAEGQRTSHILHRILRSIRLRGRVVIAHSSKRGPQTHDRAHSSRKNQPSSSRSPQDNRTPIMPPACTAGRARVAAFVPSMLPPQPLKTRFSIVPRGRRLALHRPSICRSLMATTKSAKSRSGFSPDRFVMAWAAKAVNQSAA